MIYVKSLLTGVLVVIFAALIRGLGGDTRFSLFDSIETALIVAVVLVWHYRRAH